MFVSFSWYSNYESIFEGFFDNLKWVLIVSPVLLLVVLKLILATTHSQVFVLDDYSQMGSTSPWGVGLVLVILLLLVAYQSELRERWFPFLS
ncbi:hypothetical protein R6Q59_002204 [Mikania micrantha]